MTIKLAETDKSRPLYQRIADAIGLEIAAGRLLPGQQLPTHRALAATLGVTVPTVTRAYAEAARRGLLDGQVGRGSFVRPDPDSYPLVIDLASDEVLPRIGETDLADLVRDVGVRLPLAAPPAAGQLQDAASAWLSPRGVSAAGDRLVVTAGAQQALLLALSALVPRGGRVLVEEVTYAGIRRAAAALGLVLVPVALDAEGPVPASIAAQVRDTDARCLYLTPCVQEPSGIALPASRRAAIADLVRRAGLSVVEDDACGFLADRARPLSTELPDRVVHVATLAKCLGPACRVAFVAAPSAIAARMRDLQGAVGAPVSSLVVRAATRAIAGGLAESVAVRKRALLAERVALAREYLPAIPAGTARASSHAWLPLPRPWKADAFAAHAAERGVRVRTLEGAAALRGASPRAVRLSLGAPASLERLRGALATLAALATEAPPRE